MMTILFSIAAATAAGAAAMLLWPQPLFGLGAGVGVYVVFDVMLIMLLGRRFEAYEKGAD